MIFEDSQAEEGIVNLLLLAFFVEGNLDSALAGIDRVEGAHDTEELRI
jgi:hypothetical protein